MGTLLVLLALGGHVGAAPEVGYEAGAWSVRLPLRGTAGVPEVHSGDGAVVIEVPEARVDRSGVVLPEGEGAGPIREISANTSRSRRRAVITLRLRPGAQAEGAQALVRDGVLMVRLRATGAAAAGGAAPLAGAVATAGAEAGRDAADKAGQAEPPPQRAGTGPAAAGRGANKAGQAEPPPQRAGTGLAATGTGAVATGLAATGLAATGAGTAATGTAATGTAATGTGGASGLGAAADPAARQGGALQLQGRSPFSTDLLYRVVPLLLVLGILAWLVLRRVRTSRGRDVRPTAIDIIATRLIGKGQRLMVVDVEERRFLIGASDQGVRLLARIGSNGALHREEGRDGDRAGALGEGMSADNLDGVFAEMLADLPKPEEEQDNRTAASRGTGARKGSLGDARRAEPRRAEPARAPAAEPRAAEPRAAEPRHAEPRAAEPRHAEPRAAEPRAAEPRAAEPRAAEPRATEPRKDAAAEAELRPRLQLVPDFLPTADDFADAWAGTPADLAGVAAPPARPAHEVAPRAAAPRAAASATGDFSDDNPVHSTDVAGLLALRRQRHGGR